MEQEAKLLIYSDLFRSTTWNKGIMVGTNPDFCSNSFHLVPKLGTM